MNPPAPTALRAAHYQRLPGGCSGAESQRSSKCFGLNLIIINPERPYHILSQGGQRSGRHGAERRLQAKPCTTASHPLQASHERIQRGGRHGAKGQYRLRLRGAPMRHPHGRNARLPRPRPQCHHLLIGVRHVTQLDRAALLLWGPPWRSQLL